MQAQNGTTALHNAAANAHLEVVTALLAAGADTDIQNSNGNTALHLAASKGARRAPPLTSCFAAPRVTCCPLEGLGNSCYRVRVASKDTSRVC